MKYTIPALNQSNQSRNQIAIKSQTDVSGRDGKIMKNTRTCLCITREHNKRNHTEFKQSIRRTKRNILNLKYYNKQCDFKRRRHINSKSWKKGSSFARFRFSAEDGEEGFTSSSLLLLPHSYPTLVLLHGGSAWGVLQQALVRSLGHSDVSRLSPAWSPRVLDDPVVSTVSNNEHSVVELSGLTVGHHSSGVCLP